MGKAARRRSREERKNRNDPAYQAVARDLATIEYSALRESPTPNPWEGERVVHRGIASLRTLEVVRAQRARLEELERQAVADARAGEISWSRIGTALGVTKSAACQRFGRDLGGQRPD